MSWKLEAISKEGSAARSVLFATGGATDGQRFQSWIQGLSGCEGPVKLVGGRFNAA